MKLITIGDVLETVESDPEIREMFDAFSREEARWERDDDLPDTMTSRMFIAAVNWARQNPKRWEAFFAHPEDPDAALDALERAAPSASWPLPPKDGDLLALARNIVQ